jgi:hypothetical protein
MDEIFRRFSGHSAIRRNQQDLQELAFRDTLGRNTEYLTAMEQHMVSFQHHFETRAEALLQDKECLGKPPASMITTPAIIVGVSRRPPYDDATSWTYGEATKQTVNASKDNGSFRDSNKTWPFGGGLSRP